MIFIEKNIEISMLLEIYGKMLTNKQADVVDLYYNDNLSLSEIADELNITRQGVRKNLVDAEKKLFSMEQKLQILDKKQKKDKLLLEIISKIDDEKLKNKLGGLL